MKRFLMVGVAVLGLALLGVGVAFGVASAQGDDEGSPKQTFMAGVAEQLGISEEQLRTAIVEARPKDRPTTVAIAIGQLQEEDGDSCTVDLRAASREGRTGGALRFYCPTVGYYNGGVRQLSVEDGAIEASGGGGLVRPDGTRMRVRYSADISADGQQVTIAVEGRDYEYTISGRLDPGFVRAGNPQSQETLPEQ